MLDRLVPLAGPVLTLVLACCGDPARVGVHDRARPAAVESRLLLVGPSHLLKLPSQAALVAHAGDIVLIDPGTYDDCAVWRASRLTIAASAPGVVLTTKTCLGKAIFVVDGDDVTIRGLTFTHAAVPGHNGAGVLAQGGNLTVESSKFLDNEEGILGGTIPTTTIRVTGSTFRGNGTCQEACAHAIYIGHVALLDVEDSYFTDTHVAHDIKSRAYRTVLRDNDISDGPTGDSSYLVDLPNGGDLLMEDNTLTKGPHTSNASTAVSIGEEGVTNPTASLVIRDNRFTNLLPEATAFVRNVTQTPAELVGNTFRGAVIPLVGPGTVR